MSPINGLYFTRLTCDNWHGKKGIKSLVKITDSNKNNVNISKEKGRIIHV